MIYEFSKEYFVRPLAEEDVDGPYLGWFEDQDVCCQKTVSSEPSANRGRSRREPQP